MEEEITVGSADTSEASSTEIKKDTVSHDTHKKLLSQRKRDQSVISELQEKLTHFEKLEQDKAQAEAEKRGEYDKVISSYKERMSSLEQENESYKRSISDSIKMNSFLNKLPGKIKKNEYTKFIDLEDIALDPDTGAVEETTLETAVNKFVENYSDLIAHGNQGKLPKVDRFNSNLNYGKKDLKTMSRDELKQAYMRGAFLK